MYRNRMRNAFIIVVALLVMPRATVAPAAQGSGTLRLYIARHGQTDWNLEQRFQGQTDIPLNAEGHAQAARLAARLAGDPYDRLLCSDLVRARQTAAPLATAWQQSPVALAGLREQHFGVLEGLTAEAIVHEERVRLTKLMSVATAANNIPRRLGSSASSEELATDKRRSRRVAP